MHPRILAFLAPGALAALVPAQEPVRRPDPDPAPFVEHKTVPDLPPKPVTTVPLSVADAAAATGRALGDKSSAASANRIDVTFADDPDRVLVDEPAEGTVWALAQTYKFGADVEGGTFVPFLGSEAPRNHPLHVRIARAEVSGVGLDVRRAIAPKRAGRRIDFDRGGLVEHFELRSGGVEQSFTFAALPARGELVLEIEVDTDLVPRADGDGVLFEGELGAVRYGGAVVLDAAGRRIAIPSRWYEGALRIVVPPGFVEEAELPLVVDPLLSSIRDVSTSSATLKNPDVCMHGFVSCWERVFSQSDSDVLVDDRGTLQVVDNSPESWRRPRIASGVTDPWLVVAEVQSATGPSWIGGRGSFYSYLINGWLVSFPIEIERAGLPGHASGNKLRPDVAHTKVSWTDSRFTVVWEREFTASDHDIHMKQVDFIVTVVQGTRLSGYSIADTQPRIIDSSTANESRPSISSSTGDPHPTAMSQGVLVLVYQRTFSPIDEDIRMTVLDPMINTAANPFYLDYSSAFDLAPTVSAPARGEPGTARPFMATWARVLSVTDFDIVGAVANTTLSVLVPPVNLTQLESGNVSAANWPWLQTTPVVETDGCRFVVAYSENWQNNGDMDLRVSSFHRTASGGLDVTESRIWVAGTTAVEEQPAITSFYVSPTAGPALALVWRDDRGTQPDAIEMVYYGGYGPGGYTVLSTACVPMAMNYGPEPAIGQEIVVDATGATGWIVGFPRPQPLPCPGGCVLGVDGFTVNAAEYRLRLPCQVSFVGTTLAMQPYRLGNGLPCFGIAAFGDTLLVTIR